MVRGTVKEKMMNKKNTNLTKRNGKKKMTNGKKNMNMTLGDNRKQKIEMNSKKNVNLGREGNKVEKTMNKTQEWTKKDEKLEEESEPHGGGWETKKKNED
jgi:hypothetical protein